ncbi:MAG: response regulator [Campylobacterota bacterium]|nr:response regulator [Campylobacterota bacterium]
MSKILLIEDRVKRQQLFINDTNIDLLKYDSILDNLTNGLEKDVLCDDFNFENYSYIISHKSAFSEENTKYLNKLESYCEESNTPLILFSGGLSVNYYINDEYERLEINSKTFYSENLKLFLEAFANKSENILMLSYGENWQLNIVLNILEKMDNFINDNIDQENIIYGNFTDEINIGILDAIKYDFHTLVIDNDYLKLIDIKNLRDSIFGYISNPSLSTSNSNKTLLIHSYNTGIEHFDNDIWFDSNDDIDHYISIEIIPEIKSNDTDIIFIKDNLSSNYLELYGLRVAYHIRLSTELEDKRYLPIVIISDLNIEVLNQIEPMAKILFTKNIFIVQNNKKSIENISKHDFNNLTLQEFNEEFLNKIEVNQPKDYLSHHSIANEWSIYRWGEFLKADSDALKTNKNNIASMLYFKYLIAKNPIEKTKGITFAPKSPKLNGNILYIDDQWNQGWRDIFNKYFSKSNDINFSTFEYIYKDKSTEIVLNDIKSEVIVKEPDIVILDLRLTQNDHNDIKNDQDIELLTGIKVLNLIKDINKGIQVIMITASNQTLILERLYSYGILGYIKKEHPNDITIGTKDNFAKLKNLVDAGLENKYLKEIYNIKKTINSYCLLTKNTSSKINDIKFDINSIFEILNSKMKSANSLVIITYTKILENISSIYINEHTMKYIDNDEDVGVYNPKDNIVYDYENEKWYKNTQNRLHNIIYEKLELKDKSIHKNLCELINCRNYLAHPNEKQPVGCNLIKSPNQEDILKWFEMLSKIINKIDFDK